MPFDYHPSVLEEADENGNETGPDSILDETPDAKERGLSVKSLGKINQITYYTATLSPLHLLFVAFRTLSISLIK